MKLSTWISEKGGNSKAGAILGVRRNCAYAWTRGTALPRASVMKTIVQKTKGRVSYGEMIDEYLEKRPTVKRKATVRHKKKVKAQTKVIRATKALDRAEKRTVKAVKEMAATLNGKKKKSKIDPGF